MPLSWNEIKTRAAAFSTEWKDEVSEDAEAKSFWDDFFNIFGISRRRVATFEQQVIKSNEKTGFIDLLWKGMILIEHKSRGKDLEKAYQQAKDYFPGLKEKELPRYILVSDFERFKLYDLEEHTAHEFKLTDLINHVHLFGFIAGYQKRTYKEQDPVNIEAAELMAKLHDKLKAIGYEGHHLELYLVRLVFLLFADDTNIFERGIMQDYIEQRTAEDGSDLAAHLGQLFEVLNTPRDKRFKNIDESLDAFPYVNGKLFEEHLPTAGFDSQMRQILLDCCYLDWGKISPAIFGSLFQGVMDAKARRNLGAHYTSEKNILKLIKPLFLDDLWREYEQLKDSKAKLQKFHDRMSSLRFLDPACGCGNFLIIAYRELRLLEIAIIKQLLKLEGYREEVIRDAKMDISHLVQCDVDKFYGIEYEEFPAQIAQVAMWLIDHQMNQEVTNSFGEYYVRLPLRKSATIVHGNSLRIDWQSLLIKETTTSIHADKANIIKVEEPEVIYKTVNVYAKEVEFVNLEAIPQTSDIYYDYIIGNPPFGGKHLQSKEQKEDIRDLMIGVKNASDLDYVSGWFFKAAKYINQYSKVEVAFVSTNSITQGEQVSLLWEPLLNLYNIKINFAHRTFKWSNEAKGIAAVHCVIIGFSKFDKEEKLLYEYQTVSSEPHELRVPRINAYLNSGPILIINKKQEPICNVIKMRYGNKPADGGHYIFSDSEKEMFLKQEPNSSKYFKEFIGSVEFINQISRWCLWLKDADPSDLKQMPLVLDRIAKVREFRENSTAQPTRKMADNPMLFFYTSQPDTDYLVIPETSSERRSIIPIGYVSKDKIASNALYLIPSADHYTFGILCSIMHMAWTKTTCGRLKSDYRYSASIVYNNFPWPEKPTDKQKQAVEAAAKKVLDTRAEFPSSSLADLYDPNTMPPVLVKAHQELDKAVDLCYRPQPFVNETKRIEFLFELYDKYVGGLFVGEGKKKRQILNK